MINQVRRHQLLQRCFWNPIGARTVLKVMSLERRFDTVVRNYSLIGPTNGERWFSTLMDTTPTVIDVGFHDGASTREVLRLRPEATVHAFDPSLFAQRAYNDRFANNPRIHFSNLALSDHPGMLKFYDYENMCNSLAVRKDDRTSTPREYEVSVTTLDTYCCEAGIKSINMMKIDAEGYDLQVLEGGHELLQRQAIDLFMFEFASGWVASKRFLWEAVEYFEPLPYRLYRLFNGFLCPLNYEVRLDSSTTLPAMYVGVSDHRFSRGDIQIRDYQF